MDTWAPVVGYEGLYEVSTIGELRSVARVVYRHYQTGQVVAQPVPAHPVPAYPHPKTGHLIASLYRPGVGNKRRRVHQLVLESFVGPRPPGYEGCHWNGDPAKNLLVNLYWGTRSDNMQDMLRHGRRPALSDRCGKGHLFNEENTRICPDGARACRACARDLARRKYHEARARGVSSLCLNGSHERCGSCTCKCHPSGNEILGLAQS